ncbi:MAG: hypothetical protein EHM47_15375 [Ignavibacteriales bacterium]|nr:MAG: hypothetical protein EHM47_15375 [Ignavibacteriales bacterium]
MLLLNKFLSVVLIVLISFFISCGDNEEKKQAPLKDFKDPAVQLKEAKSLLGEDAQMTFLGNFDKNKNEELIAASEINTKDEWGIKFTSIKLNNEKPEKVFETKLLEGFLEDSRLEKLNLSSKDYELLYYHSGDFFMGSGGGEVFSYVIDFEEEEVYYAHLVADNKKISLYISDNISDDEVKQLFLNTYKRDFPAYVLVQEDVLYED